MPAVKYKIKLTEFTWIDEEGRLCTWFRADHDKWLQEQGMTLYSRYAEALSG